MRWLSDFGCYTKFHLWYCSILLQGNVAVSLALLLPEGRLVPVWHCLPCLAPIGRWRLARTRLILILILMLAQDASELFGRVTSCDAPLSSPSLRN